MSLSLDIALYLRDHGRQLKGLSLADRGVLYTLAFRIGTNVYTWVSQNSLANELCIETRNIRDHIRNLEKFGLIMTKKSKKDKRKLEYRISENLYNYHQNARICEKNYRMKSVCNSDYQKNSGRNHPVIDADTGRNHPLFSGDTGRNHPVISCTNDIQVDDCTEEFEEENSPKATYKNKATLKDKTKDTHRQKRDVLIVPPPFLNEQLWKEFLEHRKSIKSPMSEIAQKKAFNALDKMHEQGQDIEQVINNSIVNGWKGLFPIKENNYGNVEKYNNVYVQNNKPLSGRDVSMNFLKKAGLL